MPRERLSDRRQAETVDLQYGDDPASLAAGIGRLGNGDPASIIGAIADVLAGKAAGPSSPGGEAP